MKPPETWPPYAYIPGQTPRHDPGIFAPYHASVMEGMDAEALSLTAAWAAGWHYLEQGYFWEAHEVLEPVWMATTPGSPERHLVQALIQIANAALKARMRRPNAVRRLCDIASDHLSKAGIEGGEGMMGLRFSTLESKIEKLRGDAI